MSVLLRIPKFGFGYEEGDVDKNTRVVLNYKFFKVSPAAGGNAFYDLFENEDKYRCEIADGLDFFIVTGKHEGYRDWETLCLS